MICPHCNHLDNRVLDTRIQKEGDIRRRRECLSCKGRFTTVEMVLKTFPHVLKKDGRREQFSREKLRRGIQLACLKRQVSLAQIEQIVNMIAQKVLSNAERELQSLELGRSVMEELRKVDDVAYVRFASVYKTFRDVQEFVRTLEDNPTL